MATSTESNPPAKESKGLSSLNEFNLEKSILRRGLATANEIELCKAHKAKLAAKGETQGPARDHGRGQGLDQEASRCGS